MTPSDLELLTQAVDGELSARDTRRLRRLLQHSEEARTLLGRLEADHVRLRQLPRAEAPGDLFKRIMCRIPREALPNHRTLLIQPRRPVISKPWIPLAVAASLFLAVGGVTLLYALRAGDPQTAQQTRPQPAPGTPDAVRSALPSEHGSNTVRSIEDLERRPPSPSSNTVVEAPPAPRPTPELVAPPRPVPPLDFLTSPLLEAPSPFETIQVRLPFLASLAEVKDRPDALVAELVRDQAHRLDLFGKNPNRCFEMLMSAARASGVTIHLDAATQARLKKGPTGSFVIYVESLTPAEIRDMLVKLAAADAKQSKREFEMLHLSPAQSADARELKELLGVDVGLWKRTDANLSARPITAGTGDAVARAVAAGTAARGPEKPAIALTFQPAALRSRPSASREVQQFLARRDSRPQGSVSLMIVVRNH